MEDMRNRLINIKKEKFIKALTKKFQKDIFFSTQIDKIIIKKSQTIDDKRVISIEGFGKDRKDLFHDKKIAYTFIEKDEKLALIYHLIALLCENEMDLVEYWNYILEYPDELIESEYED